MKTTFPESDSHVSDFVDSHAALWRGTAATFVEIGAKHDGEQRQRGAALSAELLADLEEHLMRFPRAIAEQISWRESAFDMLRRFTENCLRYSAAEQELLFDRRYQQVTRDFVHQAQAFAPGIDVDDLFQALRNVWIMNSVQILLGQQIRLTRSVFAYSMLYPSTDNFLDDAARTSREKHAFNHWVEDRIKGKAVSNHHPELDLLFDLIETEHPRSTSPQVYDSILAIQGAQRRAMVQQSRWLDDSEILRLSIAKGGTSVMAHGYLVNGRIGRDQAEFLFGFGVFLQLLDDLQDLRKDLKARHLTLFSSAVIKEEYIDEIVLRLLRFMNTVLDRLDQFSPRDSTLLREVIWRNCVLLLLTAVAGLEEYCSPRLVERLERFSPLHFRDIRDLKRMLARAYGRVRKKLVGGSRVKSVWNVLGPGSGGLWSLPALHAGTVNGYR